MNVSYSCVVNRRRHCKAYAMHPIATAPSESATWAASRSSGAVMWTGHTDRSDCSPSRTPVRLIGHVSGAGTAGRASEAARRQFRFRIACGAFAP